MRLVIRDSWFPAGTHILIEAGLDELIFVRCTFEGGRITVDESIDCPIFMACLFQGTRFDRQCLSERIARDCHWHVPPTEAAATPHPAP